MFKYPAIKNKELQKLIEQYGFENGFHDMTYLTMDINLIPINLREEYVKFKKQWDEFIDFVREEQEKHPLTEF